MTTIFGIKPIEDHYTRTWDKINKKFISPYDIKSGIHYTDKKRFKTDMWSSFYDAQGNNIYENDIVKSTTPDGIVSYYIIRLMNTKCRKCLPKKIDIETGKSYMLSSMDEMTGETSECGAYFVNTLEVIGNIHENPEFVKIKEMEMDDILFYTIEAMKDIAISNIRDNCNIRNHNIRNYILNALDELRADIHHNFLEKDND